MKEITGFFIDKNGMFKYHLGLSYVLATLKKAGYEVEHFVSMESLSLEQLVEKIDGDGVKYCLFTCFDMNLNSIAIISEEIKKINKNIVIILGGHTATFNYEKILNDHSYIDYCYIGEGEVSIVELINELEKDKSDLFNIANLAWRGSESIKVNGLDVFKGDHIDELASPYLLGIIDPEVMYSQNGDISIITSRGCKYKCNFCVHNLLRTKIKFHSKERVITELKFIYDKVSGIEDNILVNINDDMFTFDSDRVHSICTGIIGAEMQKFSFKIDTRIEFVDEKILNLLNSAGFIFIGFGLESGNPRILKLMDKVLSTDESLEDEKNFLAQFKPKIELCNKLGIGVGLYIIYGWPSETYDEGLDTYNFTHQFKLQEVHQHYLSHYKGAKVYNLNKEKEVLNYSFYDSPELFQYNLEKIPDSPSDPFLKQLSKRRSTISAISGIPNTDNNDTSFLIKNLIIEGNRIPIDFIKKNLYFKSKISFFSENDIFHTYFSSGNVFCGQYKDFSSIKIRNQIDKYNKKTYLYSSNPNDFSTNINEKILSNSSTDVKKVIQLLKKKAEKIIIEEACKYFGYCPAEKNDQLWIDNSNSVLTCRNGLKIGNTNKSNSKELMSNFEEIRAKLISKAGCIDCKINKFCSKCVKELSTDINTYCSAVKRYKRYFEKYKHYKELEYYYDKFSLTKQRY